MDQSRGSGHSSPTERRRTLNGYATKPLNFARSSTVGTPTDAERPDWFHAFLTDRATREPSPHTLQAYRQDFDAIAVDVAGGRVRIASLSASDITKESMRQAFAAYADSHEAASIRRCWSTWNTLCS